MANQSSLKEEEKVKHFPVLCDKQVKAYKERDVVTNAWDHGDIILNRSNNS